MQLQIEHLPKLKVLNFYISGLTDKSVLLKPDNQSNPEFIKNVFAYENGEYCLITPDLFAVKYIKEDEAENFRLWVVAELEDFLTQTQNLSEVKGEERVSEMAEAIANSYIRPTLNRDNGNIEILDFKKEILFVKFSGHCAGCPFAQNTLNNVIIKTFNRFIPEIKEVRLIE